jgi:septal ring factor EnvC (AmiA/AmiB activator)
MFREQGNPDRQRSRWRFDPFGYRELADAIREHTLTLLAAIKRGAQVAQDAIDNVNKSLDALTASFNNLAQNEVNNQTANARALADIAKAIAQLPSTGNTVTDEQLNKWASNISAIATNTQQNADNLAKNVSDLNASLTDLEVAEGGSTGGTGAAGGTGASGAGDASGT